VHVRRPGAALGVGSRPGSPAAMPHAATKTTTTHTHMMRQPVAHTLQHNMQQRVAAPAVLGTPLHRLEMAQPAGQPRRAKGPTPPKTSTAKANARQPPICRRQGVCREPCTRQSSAADPPTFCVVSGSIDSPPNGPHTPSVLQTSACFAARSPQPCELTGPFCCQWLAERLWLGPNQTAGCSDTGARHALVPRSERVKDNTRRTRRQKRLCCCGCGLLLPCCWS
jgi:hypothetical protein